MTASGRQGSPRRQQRATTIRSDRAFTRLELLTRDGRSKIEIIEEALDRMPLPAERDADLYDENGFPR
ncbi:hypothetical protein KRZ98_16675 [Sphingobium sp. AS12]|uniref:hypothetical protein n=1 Tax=Sphingobium sp. AS12 TaxID=2849495 RepID=UPI001C31417D|nr:hypothetical protein [Sphingobium sp. AS12]MBV2149880.1 hypothetical protein [Sphingobium sp. AS12]